MRLLLDTHVALWAVLDDHQIRPSARALIADEENPIFVSVVTLWEIAIKFARPRGRPDDMPISAAEALSYFMEAGYQLLGVTVSHALAVAELPSIHADPFDRMLIAQARSEPLRLMTNDAAIIRYGEDIVRA
jgi:PIN domain nuclease of toxin-antitoxin system